MELDVDWDGLMILQGAEDMRKKYVARFQVIAMSVAVGLSANWAWAISGVEVSAANGDATNPGTVIHTNSNGIYQQGGEGDGFETLTYNDGRGLAKAEADLTGNGMVPTVKALTQPTAGGEIGNYAEAFAGATQAYQYNGVVPALITFNYVLTADLSETPGVNAAFLRARAALVTEMEFFTTNVPDLYESSSNIEDSVTLILPSEEIFAAEVGSISFVAAPGQIFNLVISLQTAASISPAFVDAFSTFTGTLESETGSITVIPEPATAMMALMGVAALMIRRRNVGNE